MQNAKTLRRVIAAIMVAVMMLTTVPFSFAADPDETTIKDFMTAGTYGTGTTAIKWKVLEKKADGTLILISDSTVAKEKFQPDKTKAFDYENSNIYSVLQSNLKFSQAEAAALANITMSYKAVVDGKLADKTLTTKYAVPTVADRTTYGLKSSADSKIYWLADMNTVTNATYVLANGTGTKGGAAANFSNGFIRPMISFAAGSYVEIPAIENVTILGSDGVTAVKYAVVGSTVKVTPAANYSESELVVKFGGVEAEGTDGVYTVGSGEMTIEGLALNPADFTAYEAAVAKTEALDETLFSVESWANLQAALGVDVSGCTVLEQATVDAQTAAIEKAITNLKDAPADFEAYNNAVINANQVVAADTLFKYNEKVPEDVNADYSGSTFYVAIKTELKKEKDVLAMTYKQQAEVDAATKLLTDLCAAVPYKDANINEWNNSISAINSISSKTYDPVYIAECKAEIAEIVAANNIGERYKAGELDIRDQAEINAEVAKIKAVYADKDSHYIETDFSALDKALERAEAYAVENYYKDEEVEREEELGGTEAWDNFVQKRDAALAIANNKAGYPNAYAAQTQIDTATDDLIKAMDKLDKFIKLNDWDRFTTDVKYFFSDIQYTIEGIVDLLATVVGLLGMLMRGEIDLYGLFEMLDVGEDVLNFLISIGIKPVEDPEEVPAA